MEDGPQCVRKCGLQCVRKCGLRRRGLRKYGLHKRGLRERRQIHRKLRQRGLQPSGVADRRSQQIVDVVIPCSGGATDPDWLVRGIERRTSIEKDKGKQQPKRK